MKKDVVKKKCYIGWDVGGWNCDNNQKSKDALVVVDCECKEDLGHWRGNLRNTINEYDNTHEFIAEISDLCGVSDTDTTSIVMAIDTPLGFPTAFVDLVTRQKSACEIGEKSGVNPYLFRQTERYLFEHGLHPLSSVKDMIGSQATKGMHFLSKFASKQLSRGIWTDGSSLTVIEAYPSACKKSSIVRKYCEKIGETFMYEDINDALTCTVIAYLFDRYRGKLQQPTNQINLNEGWIWVPKDAIKI